MKDEYLGKTDIEKWKTVNSEDVFDLKIFTAQKHKRINPTNNKIGEFIVLNSKNWANIIPITVDDEIVVIEQYRHGSDDITFEIPGGIIELGEEPSEAAKRECREETGFSSESEIELLGVSRPNPAFLNNYCYSYIWKNCKQISLQELDINEVINIHKFSINKVKSMIESGIINHSVILTAFYFYSLKYKF